MTDKGLGQIAYEAYCEVSGNKSLVSGCELPTWEELRNEIKVAWVAAAFAVSNEVLYEG